MSDDTKPDAVAENPGVLAENPTERRATLLGPPDEQGVVRFVGEDADGQPFCGRGRPMPEGTLPRLGESMMAMRPDVDRGFPHIRLRPVMEAAAHKGPARVSTEDYTEGWERIWGAKRAPKELN